MSQNDIRPSLPTRTSTSSSVSRRSNLSLDLSNLPPLTQPVTPTNTLLFTNLLDRDIFRPDNLETIRNLVTKTAPIHSFAPLKSFARIVISFFSEEDAIAVRRVWDGEATMGASCNVYFGRPTPLDVKEERLALPDAGKLFFISPPPSPPHDWEMRLEDAPNKLVHAEDLAEALARLHHNKDASGLSGVQTPISPTGGNTRSRSSTLIFQPGQDGASPELPAIAICDMTDEPEDAFMSPIDVPKPILAHTARPPVELMHAA
ncbi:hypothetical protein MGG_03218 [Pyricularia oryzae 70-15]|uniref:Calcipressin family protein n=3 Tax=Pyricularia oryzae TaxID=318829 RepID=G4N9Z0_PYRO7|nr:uncharacterized protein MGG_03218 [Pyricularia oryzae 70-15]EHA50442.1 hypothetical protein MGG_03218 [Pyricularia oryzae 70-15]ELQ34486.1 hypothetical protein OOU_Y34scaffold00765g32 [Pyricularia oryzae Y34]KAI7931476.1 hypothetical protein M9X92_000307 [Pyricularia oryzae]KAI7931675.1 hypothetical protein M0657_001173 [Pyricularia oryzae]